METRGSHSNSMLDDFSGSGGNHAVQSAYPEATSRCPFFDPGIVDRMGSPPLDSGTK